MGRRRLERIVCSVCGRPCDRAHGKYTASYCSNVCQAEAQYRAYIDRWLTGEESGTRAGSCVSKHVRRWMFETRNGACERCGWNEVHPTTGLVPLHLDHIDGDSLNNRPENLRLLCPNCHSLTPTYGILNRGRGRPFVVYKNPRNPL